MPQNTNTDPLAQLHDIIAPTTPSWWPLPFIYWGILLGCVVISILTIYLIKKHLQKKKQLEHYLSTLSSLQVNGCNIIALNTLLKGVAIATLSREKVASLHGHAWFDFLINYSSFDEGDLFQGKTKFTEQLYGQVSRECDENDFNQANKWIKQLPSFLKKNNESTARNEGDHV